MAAKSPNHTINIMFSAPGAFYGQRWLKTSLRWPELAPRWPRKAPRSPEMGLRWPKVPPRWPKKVSRWPQDGSRMTPGWLQDGPGRAKNVKYEVFVSCRFLWPKMAQDGAKIIHDGAETAQEGTKMAPKRL